MTNAERRMYFRHKRKLYRIEQRAAKRKNKVSPEDDPAYTFVFKDTDGNEITAEYYEYDTNFYAAVVGDKVYLVNKMNVRDMDEAYQDVMGKDKETASEE